MKKTNGWSVDMVPIGQIRPYGRNPRKKKKNSIPEVQKSIAEFGFQQPIVADPDTQEIIVGHSRYFAALELKMAEVPVKWASGLTRAQKRAYRLLDNRTNEHSDWDTDKLIAEIEDIKVEDPKFDDAFLGFGIAEKKTKGDQRDDQQFILAVSCTGEGALQSLYEELAGRGFDCKLIT
jgi:ParB-like chromosome segregation protein Spo0J